MDDLQTIFNAALSLRSSVPFGDAGFSGFHDGEKGVQWHIAAEKSTGSVSVAVNLEGLKYGPDRPIRRLLHRERSRPVVADLCRRSPRAPELYAHVNREGWPGPRNRVELRNRDILTATGATLTDEASIAAMSEALQCRWSDGDRGTQSVTRAGWSQPEVMNVLPHVTVGLPVWRGATPADAVDRVRSAVSPLREIYEAFCERAGAY
jgi:hypothetical protein